MHERNPMSDVYRSCMNAIGDAEYCAGVVDAVLQAVLTRVHRYVPEGRKKPIFYIALVNDIDYVASPLVDQTKKSVAVALRGPNHLISLIYQRDDDGRFVLRRAAVSNLEYMAMFNGPLNQPTSRP